ncbi:unnamed protein product [Trichogramma brassicae]|uniref:DNA 3'-5' helicase n=1 Tax=Trichogramma brassicae TaxID=86971 RepID=A0A6H5I1L4_9HYME|nr:unnamed protein product [Trichogramma brassicae]
MFHRILMLRRIIPAVTYRPNLDITVFTARHLSNNLPENYHLSIPEGSSLKRYEFVQLMVLLRSPEYSNRSGIVYVYRQNVARSLAMALTTNGITAFPYTGATDKNFKSETQLAWLGGHYRIIVATSAFGLGIDMPDTRFVINYEIPESLATLTQMMGRAGRDGGPAKCVVFYNFKMYRT